MKIHGELKWVDVEHGGPLWGLKAAPYIMVKAKRLFPKAKQDRTGWLALTDTPETSRDLEWLCERYPMECTVGTLDRLRERAEQHRQTEEAVEQILAGGGSARMLGMEPAREPRPYQEVAARLAMETGHLLLTDDVGLGKSMSSLLVLRAPDALPALVVTLTHLPAQFQREVQETFPWLRVHVAKTLEPYDPSKKRGMGGAYPDVLIVPWSKLRGWGDHLAGVVRTVIFDEAQELRKPGSQKYTAAEIVGGEARYVLGLTATPVYNYGDEIHSVLDVIAPDVLGSREEFIREWCHGGSYNGKARVDDPAGLSLYLREQGVMLRRTRKEAGRELPEMLPVPHVVDTDHDLYERLAGDVVQLADAILARDTGRTERFRASGELDWRLRRATGLAKAPYVADFVRMLLESEERVVLYGWHRDVYDQWRARLADLSPAFYTGTESPNQKAQAVERFLHGDSRVLIVSLRAGAGLDGLQHGCKVCVFGELDWSPGIHVQCIGRLHRDGQQEPVVAYFLVSEEGSDPVIIDVLNVKRMQSVPLNDPEFEAIEPAAGIENRVRALAEAVQARRQTPPE